MKFSVENAVFARTSFCLI